MNIFKCLLLPAMLTLSAGANAQNLTIGLDLSLSNPLVADPSFSKEALEFIAEHIEPMKAKSQVKIKLLGARDNTTVIKTKTFKIKRRGQAKTLKEVAAYILRQSQDKSKFQQATNLVSWLEFNDFKCAQGGKVIVVTDGIEASEYVSGQDFITGKRDLPKPDKHHKLKDCDVYFYGVGVGRLAKETKIIRDAWINYFEQAGVKSFTAIIL